MGRAARLGGVLARGRAVEQAGRLPLDDVAGPGARARPAAVGRDTGDGSSAAAGCTGWLRSRRPGPVMSCERGSVT